MNLTLGRGLGETYYKQQLTSKKYIVFHHMEISVKEKNRAEEVRGNYNFKEWAEKTLLRRRYLRKDQKKVREQWEYWGKWQEGAWVFKEK